MSSNSTVEAEEEAMVVEPSSDPGGAAGDSVAEDEDMSVAGEVVDNEGAVISGVESVQSNDCKEQLVVVADVHEQSVVGAALKENRSGLEQDSTKLEAIASELGATASGNVNMHQNEEAKLQVDDCGMLRNVEGLSSNGRGDDEDEQKSAPETSELTEAAVCVEPDTETDKMSGKDQHASEFFPSPQKDKYKSSDLVWGKVKSHPWWPGQIFDSADASDLAVKYQKKDHYLVLYFGDNTFAWCNESQLKPFVTNFPVMSKQSNLDGFLDAVDAALQEVGRRVQSAMSCSCLPDEVSAITKVKNVGVREGVSSCAVDRSEILSNFNSEKLLDYINGVAQFPNKRADKLELAAAGSLLKAFHQSKGHSEVRQIQIGKWAENGSESVMVDATPPKRGRGRPPKLRNAAGQNDEDTSGAMDGEGTEADDEMSHPGKRKLVEDFDFDEDGEKIKRRSLNSLGDLEMKSPSTISGKSFKIGDCIRRAASQLASPVAKSPNEASYKNTSEAENSGFDVFGDGSTDEAIANAASQRNQQVTATPEVDVVEKVRARRGRKRKVVNLPAPEVDRTDHLQDAYWSDLVTSLPKREETRWPRRKRKKRYSESQSSDNLSENEQPKTPARQERPIILIDEKIVVESRPTELVILFNRSEAVPTEYDLIKTFGRYGPLNAAETKVLASANAVKVVFRKRVNAESAFSDVGKLFGRALRSFRLVDFPSPDEASPSKTQEAPTMAEVQNNTADLLGVDGVSEASVVGTSESMKLDNEASEGIEALPDTSVEQNNVVQQNVNVDAAEASVVASNPVQTEARDSVDVLLADTIEVETTSESGVAESTVREDNINQAEAEDPEEIPLVSDPIQVEFPPETSSVQLDTVKESFHEEAVKQSVQLMAAPLQEEPKSEIAKVRSDTTVGSAASIPATEAVAELPVNAAEEAAVLSNDVCSEATSEDKVDRMEVIVPTSRVDAVTEASIGTPLITASAEAQATANTGTASSSAQVGQLEEVGCTFDVVEETLKLAEPIVPMDVDSSAEEIHATAEAGDAEASEQVSVVEQTA